MAEYIEREAALEVTCHNCSEKNICGGDCYDTDSIRSIPAADVAPVRHGRWKPYDLTYGRSIYYCTACNRSAVVPTALDEPIFNYCPNCGATMGGVE